MFQSLTFPQLQRWFLKGGTAILDQGIFSGANFILTLLLARWLEPSIYGAFAVAFTVYLFFTGFHNAIILEPISVLGPSNYGADLQGYLASQYRIHFLLTIPIGFSMIIVGWLVAKFSDVILGGALVSIGIVLPFLLIIWLSRRISYLLHKPRTALVASTAYMVALLSGMFYLHSSGIETLPNWFLLMGLAALFGSIVSQTIDGVQLFNTHTPKLVNLIREQWKFGRWIVLATIFYFLGSQIQIFVIVSMLGLDAAGAYRSVQNLILPVLQVFIAITTLVFPLMAFEFGQKRFRSMQEKTLQVTTALVIVAISYEVFLIICQDWFDITIYAGKYAAYAYLIPIIGLVPIINAVVSGFSLILRSLQRPIFYLADKILAAAVGSLSAFLLIRNWGIAGAIFSLLLVESTTLLFYWYLYIKWFSVLKDNYLRISDKE